MVLASNGMGDKHGDPIIIANTPHFIILLKAKYFVSVSSHNKGDKQDIKEGTLWLLLATCLAIRTLQYRYIFPSLSYILHNASNIYVAILGYKFCSHKLNFEIAIIQ